MKIAVSAFSALAALLSTASAADERAYDTLPAFDRIDVSAGVMLVASIGAEQSVLVRTERGDFSDFKIDVKKGELNVTREWNRLSWHSKKGDYKVIVTVPALKSLEGSSGSHSKINNVENDFLVDLSSGAFAKVNGTGGKCVVDLSSGANLDGKGLSCTEALIDVSSGGNGALRVSDSVIAEASSGGHVTVYGNPTTVNVDRSSGGRIKIKPVSLQISKD